MADKKDEVSVEGGVVESENGDYSGEVVSTNFGPIRRRVRRIVECGICFKTTSSSNLKQHMKRKNHIQHGMTATNNKKISKKEKMTCISCKDEILANIVNARTELGRAETNVANAQKNVTEIRTTFADARDNLIEAERTFQIAQTNVISNRTNCTDIHSIYKNAQKILSASEATLVDAQKCLWDAEINNQKLENELDDTM